MLAVLADIIMTVTISKQGTFHLLVYTVILSFHWHTVLKSLGGKVTVLSFHMCFVRHLSICTFCKMRCAVSKLCMHICKFLTYKPKPDDNPGPEPNLDAALVITLTKLHGTLCKLRRLTNCAQDVCYRKCCKYVINKAYKSLLLCLMLECLCTSCSVTPWQLLTCHYMLVI